MTEQTLIEALTPDALREMLLAAGYRAEDVAGQANDAPILRSATGGLAFEIRFANPLLGTGPNGKGTGFADATFLAAFRVQGELPLSLVNAWNATRRFARLHLSERMLVLTLEINVLGGVAPAHLRAQLEIWDRLVQQLIAYLREEVAKLAAQTPAVEVPEADSSTGKEAAGQDEPEAAREADAPEQAEDIPEPAPVPERPHAFQASAAN